MDDFPNIHWRTHRNAWLKQSGTRLTIFDLFVLTACAAAGMMVVRGSLGEHGLAGLDASPEDMSFAVLLPCLLCGVVLGHPVVMALHWLTGRRLGLTWTTGEMLGLVPGLSLCSLYALVLMGTVFERWFGSAGPFTALVFVCLLGALFVNFLLPLLAIAYLIDRVSHARAATWTDTLGVVAALMPGGIIVGVASIVILFG